MAARFDGRRAAGPVGRLACILTGRQLDTALNESTYVHVHVCAVWRWMAGGRLRIHYCRLIVATSAVWFVVDIVLFVYFTDCLLPTERCIQQQQQAVTSSLTASRQPRNFFGRLLPGGL